MLSQRDLVVADDVRAREVLCRHGQRPPGAPSEPDGTGIVLVLRGCFIRESHGVEQVLDPAMGYLKIPSLEERFAHPSPGGDRCVVIDLPLGVFSELFAREHLASEFPLNGRVSRTQPALWGSDAEGRSEAAVLIADEISRCLKQATLRPEPHRVAPSARRLVRQARELIADDPTALLSDLADSLSVSAHHLSRTFSAVTGRSVSRHRTDVRVRLAVDRIVTTDEGLAGIAAALGFADHAHLTRTVRDHTGLTPSGLRARSDRGQVSYAVRWPKGLAFRPVKE
jgi:AraC-like DNA-binding protein